MQAQNSTENLTKAKAHLRAVGLSYRKAVPILGVTYQHLCYVLNGHRSSRRLINRIMDLKPAKLTR